MPGKPGGITDCLPETVVSIWCGPDSSCFFGDGASAATGGLKGVIREKTGYPFKITSQRTRVQPTLGAAHLSGDKGPGLCEDGQRSGRGRRNWPGAGEARRSQDRGAATAPYPAPGQHRKCSPRHSPSRDRWDRCWRGLADTPQPCVWVGTRFPRWARRQPPTPSYHPASAPPGASLLTCKWGSKGRHSGLPLHQRSLRSGAIPPSAPVRT